MLWLWLHCFWLCVYWKPALLLVHIFFNFKGVTNDQNDFSNYFPPKIMPREDWNWITLAYNFVIWVACTEKSSQSQKWARNMKNVFKIEKNCSRYFVRDYKIYSIMTEIGSEFSSWNRIRVSWTIKKKHMEACPIYICTLNPVQ